MHLKPSHCMYQNYDVESICHDYFQLELIPFPNYVGAYHDKFKVQTKNFWYWITTFHLDACIFIEHALASYAYIKF